MGNLIVTLLVKSLTVILEKQFGAWHRKCIGEYHKTPTLQNDTSLTNKCVIYFSFP